MTTLIWVQINTTQQSKVEDLKVQTTNNLREATTLITTCDYTASPAGTLSSNSGALLLGNKAQIRRRTCAVRTITLIIEVKQ